MRGKMTNTGNDRLDSTSWTGFKVVTQEMNVVKKNRTPEVDIIIT